MDFKIFWRSVFLYDNHDVAIAMCNFSDIPNEVLLATIKDLDHSLIGVNKNFDKGNFNGRITALYAEAPVLLIKLLRKNEKSFVFANNIVIPFFF